jgi:biotin synthase
MIPTPADVRALYKTPLLDLVHRAACVHRAHWDASEVQLCALQSIKTGGCGEDCGYCSQSRHHDTAVQSEPLMDTEAVLERARAAKAAGSTRFCMGAAWRGPAGPRAFARILDMVRGVRGLGLEACMTLGQLTAEQARALADAGLSAYNHNLDTSKEYYGQVVTTHTHADRLETIGRVAEAGISLCCGGIIGMGESAEDRIALLHRLATLDPQPESVPINRLVPVPGTPLEGAEPLDVFEWVRCVAVARVLLPRSFVRLSAGRESLSPEAQALAFMAGANAIFVGDTLLTAPNAGADSDAALLASLGLRGRAPDARSPVQRERTL